MGGKAPEVQQSVPVIPEESKEEQLLKKILTGYGVNRSNQTRNIMSAGDRVFSGQGSRQNGYRGLDSPTGVSSPSSVGGASSPMEYYEDIYDDLFPTPPTPSTPPVYQTVPPEIRGGGGDGSGGVLNGPAPRGLFASTQDMLEALPGLGSMLAGYVPSRAAEMAATWNGRGYSPGAMRDIYNNYGPSATRGLTAEWKAIQDAARERNGGRYGNMSEQRSRDLDRDIRDNQKDQSERGGSGYRGDSRSIPH